MKGEAFNMGQSFIEIKNLSKTFGDHQVLNDISLSINKGEIVSILGSSGSGKSTLLRCINLLEEPTSGDITIDGESAIQNQISKEKLRTKLGMVFQSFNLFENMNVLKNCMIGQLTVLKRDKETAKNNALKYLNLVGMGQFINARPSQLSGGQKQRVAIARALAMDPECLLIDEPTSALDPEMAQEVLEVMKKLASEGRTMIVVTHEMNFARKVANRVVFMEDGYIVETGPSEEFFANPKEKRSQEFLRMFTNNKQD